MPRIIRTEPFPQKPDAIAEDALLITPHRAAAEALGRPYRTLPSLARQVLRTRGIAVAPAVVARHSLKMAIFRAYPDADTSSTAMRISEILRTVLRTGIDIEQLIEQNSPRVRQLGIVAKAYSQEIAREKFIDHEERLWAASQIATEPQKLVIYGHHRARKEEVHFINSIAGEDSIYYLPCHDAGIFTVNREWADWLIARGWQVEDSEKKQPETVGEFLAASFVGTPSHNAMSSAAAYPNIEAEVRGVLSQAKLMVAGGTDPYEIAIVCRDQDLYAPMIASVANEYGMPVRLSHEVQLGNTLFGGFIRQLLDAVESDLGYEATARLLMHPFGPGMPDGAWTSARVRRASDREAWTALEMDLTSLSWPEQQPFENWVTTINAVFAGFDLRNKTAASARELIAFEKFKASLYELGALEKGREMTFAEFSATVLEILAEEKVPFATSAVGIPLFEPNTILGASFDHLFVIGMAEGVFPKPASENPVIDFYERKLLVKYGIDFEEAADVARWESLSFYLTLLAGKRSVVFSYPATVDNGERLANVFFDRLGIKPVKASRDAAVVSSVEERRTVLLRGSELFDDPTVANARRNFGIELRRENSPNYDEFDGVIGVRFAPADHYWSASQITTIGQCGFRWFAQRILKLDAVDEIELGMDFSKRGTFYHRVLEIAVRRAQGEADVRAATLRYLDEAFAEAEKDPEVDIPTLQNWELQRDEHITALRKAVESAEFISEGARVVGLEQRFKETWMGFPFSGYIDRVDDTSAGLIAIDYKTTSKAPNGAKDEDGKLTVDVQIPLYSNVGLRKLYPDGELGNSNYYSLTKGEILREEKADDLEKLERLMERIEGNLAVGNFAVDPDVNFGACSYCDFDQVCRKGPRLERKKS
ncbi:hypothetical protein BH10ACI3_BH10ACI3_10160 [soil metagenome]